MIREGFFESIYENLRVVVELSDSQIDSVADVVARLVRVFRVRDGSDCQYGFTLAIPDSE